jgi:hypothetical protein
MAESSAARARACRRRQRRGLGVFRLALDPHLVLDGLVSGGLIDEPEGDIDQKQIERALAAFTEGALRKARK